MQRVLNRTITLINWTIMETGFGWGSSEVIGIINYFRRKYKTWYNSKLNDVIDKLWEEEVLTKFLIDYYKKDMDFLYSYNGKIYPMFVREEWKKINSDSLTIRFNESGVKQIPIDNKYIDNLKERGKEIWEDDVYRLVDVKQNNGHLELNFCMGSFFQSISTLDILDDELFHTFMKYGDDAEEFNNIKECLKIRNSVAPDLKSILDCNKRCYKVGISTLLVFKTANDYKMVIQKKSGKGLSYKHWYHVVPSGTFQPRIDENAEFDIKHNILRELYEELFGGDELVGKSHKHIAYDFFYKDSKIKDLIDLFDKEKARLEITGFGIECLRTYPEISALLVVDSEEYYQKYKNDMLLNWEFVTKSPSDEEAIPKSNSMKKRILPPININDDIQLSEYLNPNRIIPAVALSLCQGLNRLQQLGLRS